MAQLTQVGRNSRLPTATMSTTSDWPAASVETRLETEDGICVLTYEKLDTQAIIASVADDRAGATAAFIGTTRDSFKGKTRVT